jgi:hypothetical protein
MIIRTIKQLSKTDVTRLRESNKKMWEISDTINPYCTSLYNAISKKVRHEGSFPIWYHPIVRENIGPFEQPEYQLKDLPVYDYSFKSDWEPNNEILKGEREIKLKNLFLELNFVQVSEDKKNGTDISLTLMEEKKMEDTFVEHYTQLSFELFGNEDKKTLFSLANFFYNKPSLYEKTYLALVNKEKELSAYLGPPLTESYISLFSLKIENNTSMNFNISKMVVAKEMLFFRSSAYDLVRQGYEHLASFRTYGETDLECVQLQLRDDGLLAVDFMLKNSYLERDSTSISSKNYKKLLEDSKWTELTNKKINNWLKDIILQTYFAEALFSRMKNIALIENV